MKMTTSNVPPEDYVTIVSVGNSEGVINTVAPKKEVASENAFVTVLSIGTLPVEEEVIIYRLPGEKLGFGLKFEGGTKSAECVRRLFIQSCNSDSPAGRARAAWGPLVAGDEILRIDNFPVTNLTRLECVRCLKDSNVAVTLLVRHDLSNKFESEENSDKTKNRISFNGDTFNDTSALPPPVPPRKIHKKVKDGDLSKSLKSSENISRSSESITIENGIKRGSAKNSPCRPRKLVPPPSPPPPEAQVYTDLFSNEKENGILVAESESDDTGSSISTVIDRLSMYSSFPGSVDNSIPSTPTLGIKQLNLQNVFSCLDSIGQSLMADMPPSIVDEKMKVPKSQHIHSSHEKLPLTKTKSNASEESLHIIENSNSMSLNNVIKKVENGGDVHESNKLTSLKDSNNNKKNIVDTNLKITESTLVSTDTVDGTIEPVKKPVVLEAPKPKPRTINKKNVENTFGHRKYDENLSLSKIHCIESWLEDSCKITHDSSSDARDDDREIVRPEALPRLIDFVPKSTKIVATPNDHEEKVVVPLLKDNKEVINDNSNSLRVVINRDAAQEWCSGAGSPHLETIYEDLSTCPTLLIEESSRHPPAGDSGSDQGNHPSLEETSVAIAEISEAETTVAQTKCHETNVIEEAQKNNDSEECRGISVSRGPRSPPDGRENPIIHLEDSPPPITQSVYDGNKYRNDVLKLPFSTKTVESNDIHVIETNRKEDILGRHLQFQKSPDKVVKDWEKKFTRGKDEKCNGSVKDKIAMFSANKSSPPEPAYPSAEKKCSNFKKVDTGSNGISPVARSISLQIEPIKKQYGTYDRNTTRVNGDKVDYAGTLPRSNPDKNATSIIYNRALSYDGNSEVRANAHKTTLNQLIEQRRQSMSKLRGLVIPDAPCVINLPEIKSRDSLNLCLSSLNDDKSTVHTKHTEVRQSKPSLPSWDSQPVITNIPKYSPAFKRKPLQVYGPKLSRDRNGSSPQNNSSILDMKYSIPAKPPRSSLDLRKPYENNSPSAEKVQTLPTSFKSSSVYQMYSNLINKSPESSLTDSKDIVDAVSYKSPSKTYSDILDSDNDSSYLSTVSSPTPSLNTVDNTESDCSSQSTLSQNNEKKFVQSNSLFDYTHSVFRQENGKSNVCRSLSSDTSTSGGSSNSSTLTSGSQASCSSAGSTDTGSRVLKPRSIEAINRKNILASAKCRSGKDKYGSPLIERKFSDVESTDEDVTVKVEPVIKPRNDSANTIMRVAYSTLVEDKFSQNETDTTYSDDSDCDYGSVTLTKTELTQRYSNGTVKNISKVPTKDIPNRISNVTNNVVKSPINHKSKPVVIADTTSEFKAKPPTMNNIVNGNGIVANNCNGVAKKISESDNLSSSCVSEDELDNLCEVKLSRGASGGVGVTLAGGSDCEAKNVTIHKVLQGSAAERDGRLRKGDKVISINGHSMKNITHAQSVTILKEPSAEVCIVVCSKRKEVDQPTGPNEPTNKSSIISVILDKTVESSAGLGISLQGGGIAPLIINKLFTGGIAANSGKIPVGCELVAVNDTKLTGYTRTQAWGLLRGLAAGPVTLQLRPP